MDNLDKNIDLIERFFEESLNEEELKLFHIRLKTDPEFSKAYQVEKDIVEGIQAAGDINLRNRLDQIHKTKIESTQKLPTAKRIIFTRKVRMLAAVVILAIIATIVIDKIISPPSGESIFMASYESPSFRELSRGEAVDSDALLNAAKEKFNAKDFRSASDSLNKFLTQNPNNEIALFMKGVCQLETEDFAGASNSFNAIPSTSERYDIAVWYLGLTYLRMDKLDAAKVELLKLTDGTVPTGPKRKAKAEKLVDILK